MTDIRNLIILWPKAMPFSFIDKPINEHCKWGQIKQEIRWLKKSKRTNTGKLRNEANKKHVAMCNQAMSVIGKLNKLLDKYDNSDSDDSD